LPRSEKNWRTSFRRNDPKNLARRKRAGEIVKEPREVEIRSWTSLIPARVIGEPDYRPLKYKTSAIRRFAAENYRNPTPAERRLDSILWQLNDGALQGRYRMQHPISGKWIVDFFFPEVRLAIEVDGGYHASEAQQARDAEKEADCARFDITLVRLTNTQVFGQRETLVAMLRAGWKVAMHRENRIIGTKSALPRA
jgi:very-short-patch-repair endonuclease